MRVNEGSFLDGLKFLFKLPRLSESVHSAFSSSVKSDYGAEKEKEEKENRFWKFDLSAPDVKSASRKKSSSSLYHEKVFFGRKKFLVKHLDLRAPETDFYVFCSILKLYIYTFQKNKIWENST